MPAARPCRLAPGWMLGVVPEGIVLVGPGEEVAVGLAAGAATRERTAAALARGARVEEVAGAAGASDEEARGLLEVLERSGALGDPPARPSGASLLEALLDEAGTWDVAWTAEEALTVPVGLSCGRRRELLEDFVAGAGPPGRRRAYAWALEHARPTVWGDVPDAGVLGRAPARRPGDGAVGVLDLRRGTAVSLPAAEAGRVGAGRPHRLGTVRRLGPLRSEACDALGLAVSVAEHAAPDPRRAGPPGGDMRTKGVAPDRATADLIARAEAAERQAAGDLRGRGLVRAAGADLEGAIPGDRLFRLNERQRDASALAPYEPAGAYLWAPARTLGGALRHVLAEAVFVPFADFQRDRRVVRATSSGVAAGPTLAEAETGALRELVERDAFMWTWVQRISRERIEPAGLPVDLRERVRAVRARGLEVTFVDLTLETDPVVLCAVHDEGSLTVGARCHPDPARAAEGAFHEAAVTRFGVRPRPAPEPGDVRSPADHEALHRGSARAAAQAAFLHGAAASKELGDVRGAEEPIAEALAGIGDLVGEPVLVELTTPRSRPFHVARAFVPGLVPIAFGHDREPLGMPLLAWPRRGPGGTPLGRELDLATAGPLPPHPFA